MDNLVTSVLSAAVFIAFVAGLAESISEPPFIVIVAIVILMMCIDVAQSNKHLFTRKNNSDK